MVPPSIDDAEDPGGLGCRTTNDDIAAAWQAAWAWPEIDVPGSANQRMVAEQDETTLDSLKRGEGPRGAVVEPETAQVRPGLRCDDQGCHEPRTTRVTAGATL